jgi:hypothetical protein
MLLGIEFYKTKALAPTVAVPVRGKSDIRDMSNLAEEVRDLLFGAVLFP